MTTQYNPAITFCDDLPKSVMTYRWS